MNKFTMLFSLCCLILLTGSCKKDSPETIIDEPTTGAPPSTNAGSLSEVNVPDGFNFSVAMDVNFNITFYSENSNPINNVSYTILGVNHNEETEILFESKSGESTTAIFDLSIPNHFKSVVIKTEQGNDTKYFEYLVTESIEVNLTVNGFTGDGGDTRSNNCYPTINNTFTEDNTGFTINTDQNMTSIEITYMDGTKETITVDATTYTK